MKKASEIQSHYEEGAAPAWRICQQPTVVAVAKVSAWLFLLLFLLPTEGFRRLCCIITLLTLSLIYLKKCLILSKIVYVTKGLKKMDEVISIKSREKADCNIR